MGDARRLDSTYLFDKQHDEVAAGRTAAEFGVTGSDETRKTERGCAMSEKQQLFIGGLGAIVPVAASLLVVDYEGLAANFSWYKVFGYAVKVLVLFGIGALVVYLNPKETNRLKVFQLGLGAPALILSMINGLNVQHLSGPTSPADGTPSASLILPWESVAYAQEPVLSRRVAAGTEEAKLKSLAMPQRSAAQSFLAGLTGRPDRRVWFVIVRSEPKLEEARRSAADITAHFPGFKAEVYKPYKEGDPYPVVIGANLELREAQILREKAVKAGMPADTRLWTFPTEETKP
jgi:hypothetical protein